VKDAASCGFCLFNNVMVGVLHALGPTFTPCVGGGGGPGPGGISALPLPSSDSIDLQLTRTISEEARQFAYQLDVSVPLS